MAGAIQASQFPLGVAWAPLYRSPATFSSNPKLRPSSPKKPHAEPSTNQTMATIGIPIKLLHESQGHVVTVELTNGQVYRGKLLEAEDNCNAQLKDVTMTARDGRVSHLENVYIRGSHVRFFLVPEMLRNAPMFRNNRALRARGAAAAGRASGWGRA
jgi:small nuclear ribonucleoprotein D3